MTELTNNADLNNEYDMCSEERASRRAKTLKKGMLGFGEQFAGQECVVRDMSDTGARIQFENQIALPRFFTLHIEIDGFKVECELVWQALHFAGLRFVGEREVSALGRTQVLKDQQNALSEHFLNDYEMREKAAKIAEAELESQPAIPKKQVPLAFGKRSFEA